MHSEGSLESRMGSQSGRTVAFSTFVFDTLTGELKRNGRRVHLPDQAARLLTVLVQNPGELITREELRSHLWPDGEVVDYDHSIHRTVSQLRAILRDRSSKSSRYIVTFPKRGYRFDGQLKQVPASTDDEVKVFVPQNEAVVEAATADSSFREGSFREDVFREDVAISAPELALAVSVPADKVDTRRSRFWHRRTVIWAASIAAVLAVAVGIGLEVIHVRRQADAHLLSLGIVPFEASGTGADGLAESFRMDLADLCRGCRRSNCVRRIISITRAKMKTDCNPGRESWGSRRCSSESSRLRTTAAICNWSWCGAMMEFTWHRCSTTERKRSWVQSATALKETSFNGCILRGKQMERLMRSHWRGLHPRRHTRRICEDGPIW